ncbi:MAG TPA: metalloregulator ArsR/SmtB family transcription factor [Opitutaceae bacterium]|nr:metalloregulator ArsR/SmtB family transcription factor [Opitutaceae bacterium]
MNDYPSTIDYTFAALAHPTRRRILELLSKGESCVTDLADKFPSSLNVVSEHIRSLERAGLVQRSRDGRVHRLRFNAAPLAKAASFVERYRAEWEHQLDQLGAYLDEMAHEEKKPSRHGKSRKPT